MSVVVYLSNDPRCVGSQAVAERIQALGIQKQCSVLVVNEQKRSSLPEYLKGTPTAVFLETGIAYEGGYECFAALESMAAGRNGEGRRAESGAELVENRYNMPSNCAEGKLSEEALKQAMKSRKTNFTPQVPGRV